MTPGRPSISQRPLGVILTAGMGTRLRPLTPDTPKALVPLLNRPLVSYSLELMHDLGLDETVVVVGGDDHATAARVCAEAPAGLDVQIAVQPAPRGPGDAVASVGASLTGRPVIVLAVDTVLTALDRSVLNAFLDSEAVASLLLKPVADPRAFGVAVVDGGRVVDLEEKPSAPRSDLALVGLWMLRPAAVDRICTRPVINARGESDLTATVGELVREGHYVQGAAFTGDWHDGGTLDGLLRAQCALMRRRTLTVLSTDVRSSRLDAPLLLAPGAVIEHCHLTETVVGAGAVLRDVRLTRALVAPGARLEGGAYSDVVVTRAGVCGPGSPVPTSPALEVATGALHT